MDVATATGYGLYSPGTKVMCNVEGLYRLKRFYYRGPRGWVFRRKRNEGDWRPEGFEKDYWYSMHSRHYSIPTSWATPEEAEKAALMIVLAHPEWMGRLEVRKV